MKGGRGLAVACIAAAVLGSCATAPNPPKRSEALRGELLALAEEDQAARRARDPIAMMFADDKSRARLKEIVERHGWPGSSLVGPDGADAAWLLAQHADRDREFQRRVLGLMAEQVKRKEASAGNYAYLHDRIHDPQRYGTQGRCTGPGKWTPRRLEDPERVDELRREVGLDKLADYAKLVGEKGCSRFNG